MPNLFTLLDMAALHGVRTAQRGVLTRFIVSIHAGN